MEDGGYRTNQRLECFFKRHLGQKVSDALRISEPCIVVGENYGHAFKFVALTDEKLFILANPPQTEQDIELAIELQNITEINHVHDIPDFLSGDLQKNAQHFSVTYTKQNSIQKPQGNSASVASRSSQRISSNGKNGTSVGKRLSSSPRVYDSSVEELERSRNSRDFEESMENVRTSTIRFKFDEIIEPQTRNRSHSDPLSMADLPAEAKTAIAVPLRLSCPQNVSHRRSASAVIQERCSRSRPLPPPAPGTEKTNASAVMSSPNLRASGRRRRSNERRKSKDDANEKAVMKKNLSESQLERHVRVPSPISNRNSPNFYNSEQKLNKTVSSFPYSATTDARSLPTIANQSLSASISARIGNYFGKTGDKNLQKERASHLKASYTKTIEEVNDDVFDIGNNETTLDIYLINGDSKFILLLRTTRINFIIALTLEINQGKEKSPISASSKIMEEFHQLKEEIIKCSKIENSFILTKELLAGCKKIPFIKKLFWKTDELINYFIRILEGYLITHQSKKLRGDEADELDFMLIIAELIISMVFNTEILSSRNKILFGHRGSTIVKLVKISLMKPCLLNKKESDELSTAAALLLAGVDHQQKLSEKELELTYLLGEWTDACTSLLYESLNASEQCSWTYREGKGISVHNLMEMMDQHPNIESFLDEMIQRIMQKLIKDKLNLKQTDVVLLFKQFSLLHFIFDNSSRLSKFLADNYYEEFRYYIGSPQSMQRIPDCPLSSILASLITNVSLSAINT